MIMITMIMINHDHDHDHDCNGADLHGRWKNGNDGEHVLEGIDEVGEGEHGEGEGVDVPRLQHHLALQQDQRDHLQGAIVKCTKSTVFNKL